MHKLNRKIRRLYTEFGLGYCVHLSFMIIIKLIWKQELTINGEGRVLYYSRPSHKLLAVLLMTREIGYKGAYSLQSHIRNTPFIKE